MCNGKILLFFHSNPMSKQSSDNVRKQSHPLLFRLFFLRLAARDVFRPVKVPEQT